MLSDGAFSGTQTNNSLSFSLPRSHSDDYQLAKVGQIFQGISQLIRCRFVRLLKFTFNRTFQFSSLSTAAHIKIFKTIYSVITTCIVQTKKFLKAVEKILESAGSLLRPRSCSRHLAKKQRKRN